MQYGWRRTHQQPHDCTQRRQTSLRCFVSLPGPRRTCIESAALKLTLSRRMKAHGLPDATLVCKGAYIMVHRTVLKQWTPWFEDKIRDLDEIDLESEDVWALDLLIHFCYTGIYD